MTVSIIVPIYNSEKYLADCIESIMMQRHIDFELLLVDNGSTDKSVDICNEYIKRDSRIRLLREETRGTGPARNKGLIAAKGEYFTFVDSDDYVSENYVSRMLECIKKFDADLVECGAVFMLGSRDILRCVSHEEYEVRDQKILSDTVWGKLYKTETFKDIRFNNDRMGEDASYTRKIKRKGAKCCMCEYCLYGCRSYLDSITQIKPDRRFFKMMRKADEELFSSKTDELLEALEFRHEEAVYIKELKKLKKMERERYLNTGRLDRVINENKKPFLVYTVLRIRLQLNRLFAAIKIRSGYKYVLD